MYKRQGQGIEKYDVTKVFGPLYTTETIQGSMNAVSANSNYKAEALKVLQLMNTDATVSYTHLSKSRCPEA